MIPLSFWDTEFRFIRPIGSCAAVFEKGSGGVSGRFAARQVVRPIVSPAERRFMAMVRTRRMAVCSMQRSR